MRNTPNYNLPQYEGTDKFTKEVLNDAFNKVDIAINDLQETFNVQVENDISSQITNEVITARQGNEKLVDNLNNIKNSITANSNSITDVNSKVALNTTSISTLNNDIEKLTSDIEMNYTTKSSFELFKAYINSNLIMLDDRLINETDDDGALQRTLDKIKNGQTLLLTRDLSTGYQKIVDKRIIIDGNGNKITCNREGASIVFNIKADGVMIKNVNFDQALKGRTVIKMSSCTDITIDNCSFTGYSKEFGYNYTDSAILCDGNIGRLTVSNCKFKDFGYNYPLLTENLNRCITINAPNIDIVNVIGCVFDTVMQGIVGESQELNVTNCVFNNVKDNAIYTNIENCSITGTTFRNGYEEGVVISGGNYNITGCHFRDNKVLAIALKGHVRTLSVDNCTFISDVATTGQVIVCRMESGLVTGYADTFNFVNNVVRLTALDNSIESFQLNNIDSGVFSNNTISIRLGQDAKIFRLMGYTNVFSMRDNTFKNLRSGGTASMFAFNSDATTVNFLFEGNAFEHSTNKIYVQADRRVKFIGYEVNQNVASLSRNFTKNIFYCDSIPNWSGYSWEVGDRVNKINTDNADNIVGWVVVSGGTNPTWKTITRTA